MLPRPATSSSGELVERLAIDDGPANPGVKGTNAFCVECLLLVAQEIGPFQRPEVGKLVALEKRIDQPGAFVLPGIGEESSRLGREGQHADGVEVGASEKFAVAAQLGRLHSQGGELGKDVAIDVIVLGHILPHEAWSSRNEGKSHHRLTIEVAHQNGRLAISLTHGQTVAIDCNQQVRCLEAGEASDIEDLAVGEPCRHLQLRPIDRVVQDGMLVRSDANLEGRSVSVWNRAPGACRDPGSWQQMEFAAISMEALAALVRKSHGRLGEDQAVVGPEPVDAPA